jgi:hypothetical protein
MPLIMSHHDNPDRSRRPAKQNVIRKTTQINPLKTKFSRMRPTEIFPDHFNKAQQLNPEFIRKTGRDILVIL